MLEKQYIIIMLLLLTIKNMKLQGQRKRKTHWDADNIVRKGPRRSLENITPVRKYT